MILDLFGDDDGGGGVAFTMWLKYSPLQILK